jgi:hypothetical protein
MLIREIAQEHWVILALGGGLVMVLLIALSYIAMWKTRKVEEEEVQVGIKDLKSFYLWFQAVFPWVLILTILGLSILAIVYPVLRAYDPPNW